MSIGTQVQTAEGDVKTFVDVVSRFIVSHPKASVLIAVVATFAVEHFLKI